MATKPEHPRHKKGTDKACPGKLLWVHGTKKVFFTARKEEWLRESEKNRSEAFYTKMMKLYIKKYSYHLRDDQDLAKDIADPPDSAADKVVHEMVSPEEQEERTEYSKLVRGVSGRKFSFGEYTY
jgi:hypothetical protein